MERGYIEALGVQKLLREMVVFGDISGAGTTVNHSIGELDAVQDCLVSDAYIKVATGFTGGGITAAQVDSVGEEVGGAEGLRNCDIFSSGYVGVDTADKGSRLDGFESWIVQAGVVLDLDITVTNGVINDLAAGAFTLFLVYTPIRT